MTKNFLRRNRESLTKSEQLQKGVITTYVLVFGFIFLIMLGGLLSFILLQLRQSAEKAALSEALHVAEAGINYYRWCLNNEIEATCETEKDYFDPSGNRIGHFSLETASAVSCGQTIQKTITSEGWTEKFPTSKRKVRVVYGRESVAKYSYVLNDNVWIGADHEIRGPYQSNGGIRMDGENQSLVSSAKETWICTSSFGCSPCPTSAGCTVQGSNCVCPGVFTTTSNSDPDLFSFPVPPFDFTGITIDLAQMKSSAQSSGIYLPPSVNINPQGKGYHIKFINNGTFEAWIITQLSSTYAYSLEEGWHYDYFTISNQYLYNTYSIPPACSAIFVEDNLWPEGEVKGKVVIASANLITPSLDTEVVLAGEINYTALDGSDGLAMIAERNMLIGPQSPRPDGIKRNFRGSKRSFWLETTIQ